MEVNNKANENMENNANKRPQLFVKSIEFNDGTELQLNHNSIVVFVGSNNCGKSQVLRDIERYPNTSNLNPIVVINDCEFDYCGNIFNESFISDKFSKEDNKDYYYITDSGDSYHKSSLQRQWKEHSLNDGLCSLFINLLSTEERITDSNELKRNDKAISNPIYKLSKDNSLLHTISNYFRKAFGVDLIVNLGELQSIPLHVGDEPNGEEYNANQMNEYWSLVNQLPKLEDQGDGMRSFASILLDTFTSDHTITLIDEPESFLHPPQARIIGEVLANHNPDDRQLFISTHSDDILKGLLSTNNQNITVVRINRIGNINKIYILQNDKIKELWDNPILRYSNILTALFHDGTIVCESDYDCLFYQAVADSLYGSDDDKTEPDILYTHCGGKDRIIDIVKALRAVNAPVVAIYDFDVLRDSKKFRNNYELMGGNWKDISSNMKKFIDSINGRNSQTHNVWEDLKKEGMSALNDTEEIEYEQIEKSCRNIGLFIVPVGEIEGFDKSNSEKKKDWVFKELKDNNFEQDYNLHEARVFMQSIICYIKEYDNNK